MTFFSNMRMPDYSWGSNKTENDPCPAGWRVPDGGENGIWAKALGCHKDFEDGSLSNGNGLNFSGKFGSDSMISYPAAGYRCNDSCSLSLVGSSGYCWSVPPLLHISCSLCFGSCGSIYPASIYHHRNSGYSVRCVRE